MNDLVTNIEGKALVSSRVIADKFGKTHDSVVKAANNIIVEMESDPSRWRSTPPIHSVT